MSGRRWEVALGALCAALAALLTAAGVTVAATQGRVHPEPEPPVIVEWG